MLGILLSILELNLLLPVLPLWESSPGSFVVGAGVVVVVEVVVVVGVLCVISIDFLLNASQTSKSPSKSDGFTPWRSG